MRAPRGPGKRWTRARNRKGHRHRVQRANRERGAWEAGEVGGPQASARRSLPLSMAHRGPPQGVLVRGAQILHSPEGPRTVLLPLPASPAAILLARCVRPPWPPNSPSTPCSSWAGLPPTPLPPSGTVSRPPRPLLTQWVLAFLRAQPRRSFLKEVSLPPRGQAPGTPLPDPSFTALASPHRVLDACFPRGTSSQGAAATCLIPCKPLNTSAVQAYSRCSINTCRMDKNAAQTSSHCSERHLTREVPSASTSRPRGWRLEVGHLGHPAREPRRRDQQPGLG